MMEEIYTLMKSSTMAHGSLFKFDGKDLQSNFGLQQCKHVCLCGCFFKVNYIYTCIYIERAIG
jgi:hypothetical protein